VASVVSTNPAIAKITAFAALRPVATGVATKARFVGRKNSAAPRIVRASRVGRMMVVEAAATVLVPGRTKLVSMESVPVPGRRAVTLVVLLERVVK